MGAISVIRVSGEKAGEITRRLAAFLPERPESHKIYYGILHAPQSGEAVDEVLLSYFAHGRSFTGEVTCEISCHGSEAVVNEILRLLVLAGARPAERGEFTYRAFMNGRLDLVQAESVLAMIESRSPRATRLALRQLQGDFSVKLRAILDRVTWVLANLEANIDFAAEDIVVANSSQLANRLEQAITETKTLLAGYHQGRILRSGFQVALVGRPNAGKSSLLNALAGEDRAIVTPIAGTTRDFVEAQLLLEGVRVTLIDTAGLRTTEDPVEKIGVERTLQKMRDVDLIFYVCDAASGVTVEDKAFFGHVPWSKTLAVVNKIDLCTGFEPADLNEALAVMRVSAASAEGLEDLRQALRARLRLEVGEDSTLVSNARHFRGLEIVRDSLDKTLPLVLDEDSPDLIALELQTAIRALYEILGLTYDDQVMDRVFKEFCLGK
ncbi:MAG: tRNA uridine-5-carboxymethylaminomethyl(34) synthesis GTPase MnmE [Bdellovibrionales bacterium]|nr:tRNA uridine-5-carboxymethylaminomethyl(34) synthesis GTPase MnmE [Bdellovibrionales bacterium]